MEDWLDIQDYKGLYQVSSLGRVRSLKRDVVLKARKQHTGYLQVALYSHGCYHYKYIHRLVAETFLNESNKKQVNHKNGIKTDNSVSNLEWCTPKENTKHAINNSLRNTKGSKNPRAKLTEAIVSFIRKCYKRGILKQCELADIYNVGTDTLSNIIKHRTWKHV